MGMRTTHSHPLSLPVPRATPGGARRDRTADPLLAKQVLSQLSYGPFQRVVGLGGFEPPTSPLSGVRSSHLSYRPGLGLLDQVISVDADASTDLYSERR